MTEKELEKKAEEGMVRAEQYLRDNAQDLLKLLIESKIKKQTEALKEFARAIIADHCWGYNTMDGADIQEFAEKLGLIVPHIATEEDIDDESDYEVGDRIYKFSEVLE